jgi:hypothetical protein
LQDLVWLLLLGVWLALLELAQIRVVLLLLLLLLLLLHLCLVLVRVGKVRATQSCPTSCR